jgi:signal transduction histidine kinase
LCRLLRELAELQSLQHNTDSAFYYAHKSLKLADSLHIKLAIKLYKNSNNYQQAFYYQGIQMLYQDSLQNEKQQREFYAQEQDYKIKEREMEAELLKAENTQQGLVQKMLIAGLLVAIILLFLLWRNNQFRQKTNMILENKNRKIEKQAQSLEAQTQYLNETNQSLLQLNEEIHTQAETLHEINHTKDKLFSIIGHDLRSPINSLKGFLDLLANRDVTQEEFMMFVPTFQKNVNNVHETLENLLQWSKTQMGGIQITLESNNLFNIVESKISLFTAVTESKKIELLNNIANDITVFSDTNHLKIILQNLLSNAIKFTPTNGNITISAKVIENFVEIAVSDTGVGMTDEQQEKLFGATSHFTTYGTNGEKGTGLGLLLCKEFVERNGGKISLKSIKNQGTVFFFTLPIDKTDKKKIF